MVFVDVKHHVYLLSSGLSVATSQLIHWPLDRIERRQLSPVAGGDGVYPSASSSHTQLRIEFSLLGLVPEILPNSSGLFRSQPPPPLPPLSPPLPRLNQSSHNADTTVELSWFGPVVRRFAGKFTEQFRPVSAYLLL